MANESVDFYFSGEDLNALARDLRAAAIAIGREVAPVLVEIGEGIEERARRIAGDYAWKTGRRRSILDEGGETTQQVIDSIHGHLEGMYTYKIRAGEGVPLAALWELGNKNSGRGEKEFWHPLFGDRSVKYYQPKHPFLLPALAEDRRNITRKMESLWDRALTPYNLAPEGTITGFDASTDYSSFPEGFTEVD